MFTKEAGVDSNPKIFFQWQNPVLRDSIYPFRKEKLRDFLRVYHEIDLWQKAKGNGQPDSTLQDKMNSLAQALRNEHERLESELRQAIEVKGQTDKWFAAITGTDEKSLRFKHAYYLDRQIDMLTDRHAEMQSRQTALLKRVDWYAEEDTRRNIWIERARELDEPIAKLAGELEAARNLRNLFKQQEQLPKLDAGGGVSVQDAVRWEVLSYQKELGNLDHTELIRRVLERFDQQPERFEKWLLYMVVHFSGMRYRSAHASWADPKFLLELLDREFARIEIQSMDEASVTEACQQAVHELEEEREDLTNPEKIRAIDQLIAKLSFWNPRRALLEYHVAREIGEIQALPDEDKIFVGRLEKLRKSHPTSAGEIPDWVWQEITKYTPLRLRTMDKDWENISPERWKYENRRWREILDTWEHKDITGWRMHHRETLELIVTRAVCNEIAEHIQHLRGLIPGAGLTSKPKWYLNWREKTKDLQEDDPRRAYLVQAPEEKDFVSGASILWLDWVDREPNAWQIAQPLPGFNLLPRGVRMPREKTANTTEWSYHQVSNRFIRNRRKPTLHELRQKGRSEKEIEAIREDLRINGGFVKQYLRWTHEATVVSVEEMIDGKVVLTFETGQIGLVVRRLSDLVGNPNVFVGYIPKSDQEPDNLDELIDRAKLLPD